MKSDGTWDIRISQELVALFDKSKPYYFKVDSIKAQKIVDILSRLYETSPARIVVDVPKLRKWNCNASYYRGTIYMYTRNHAKSIFHEFYHDLDWKTHHLYDSSDHVRVPGVGTYGLAWDFAERLWKQVHEQLYSQKQ